MTLRYNPANPIFQGQNIRPPLGSFFNGQSYWMRLFPELGRSDRSVLVVKMILQFQFEDGENDLEWTQSEKNDFAHDFVNALVAVWSEKFRISTTSTVPSRHLRDVGVVFEFPYFIDGWHTSDDFELGVTKMESTDPLRTSSCRYSIGNVTLDSNDLRPESKGATMNQRGGVHEFGHMLGLRDEYSSADDNPHHTTDLNSIMNVGEVVRERHYAPFAQWLTEQFRVHSRLTRSTIDYKVNGTHNMSNSLL